MLDVNNRFYQSDLKYAATYLCNMKEKEKKRKIKVLIIGASGLVGSHLTDIFAYYNENIYNLFELYVMGRNDDKLKKRFQYIDNSKISYIVHDIRYPIDSNVKYDYIFHFASNADPGTYKRYPTETIETNVMGTINVINYAKTNNDVNIIFTSTIEVYGENDEQELKEDMYGIQDINSIRSGYPESKIVAELLYRSAYNEYGLRIVIGRLGYIYGPTMAETDDKIVAQMLRCAIDKKLFRFETKGMQKRSYCYVTDAVTGIITIILKGKKGEAYNIADRNSIVSLYDLAEIIHARCGLQFETCSKIRNRDTDAILCTDKIRNLGWEAVSDIEEGVVKTANILMGVD